MMNIWIICSLILIAGIGASYFILFRRFSNAVKLNPNNELKKYRKLEGFLKRTDIEEHMFEAILNSMFEGVIALDDSLNIIFVNPRFRFLFGLGPGEWNERGMPLLEFCRSAELEEIARRVILERQACEQIIKRYTSGTEQHFRVFATSLNTASVPGVVIVLSDISRLAKLEQIRKDFTANVSHELRTPIQLVKGFAENILDSSMENKDQIRYFTEIIKKNAATMANITDDLLTLVSLENNSLPNGENGPRFPMEKTSIASVIAEAASMVEIAASKKNIHIETSCPQELEAKLYESLFIQALINLLNNAIKYSNAGTRIKVFAYSENEQLIIEVKDKGIGIPAEHMSRIFERFYRVDNSRSKEEGGTGLGLAIVRHIALLHSGTVEVESHAGEGSVFTLKLPLGLDEQTEN